MKTLNNPSHAQLKDTPEDFLKAVGEAAFIYIEGKDTTFTRGIVTLSHGNEPSGIRALHRWLKKGVQPICNIICFIPSVHAALIEPLFKYRVSPGQRDMNRCFLPPFYDDHGRLAEAILEKIMDHQPECILDIHNTSGHSPDFGVATCEDPAHEALVSLFSERLIITDLRLGAMMETSTHRCPVVTIECGGAQDEAADEVAWQGLLRYVNSPDVMQLEPGHHMDLYRHPVRLELTTEATIAYSDSYVLGTDLTVPFNLDQYNFGTVEAGVLIGWLGSNRGAECLRVNDSQGEDVFSRFFTIKGNQLLTAQPLKLFMITTRPDIAIGDCLLYASEAHEHTVLDT